VEKPRELVAEVVIRRGIDEPLWITSLIDGRQQIIVRNPGSEDWSAERFDLALDPRGVAEPERIDASSKQAGQLLERFGAARTRLQLLRDAAWVRPGSHGKLDDAERAQIESLGYGGDARGKSFEARRLCFDGCVWRP
jgi:hypothetical protein